MPLRPRVPRLRPARRPSPRRRAVLALGGLLLAGPLVVLGSAAARHLTSPAREGEVPVGAVVVATGATKGVYYAYGSLLAAELGRRSPELRPTVLGTSGSVDNLRMVADGRATFAFAAGDAVAEAYQGREPFSAPLPLRGVARVYDDYVHLVVPVGSPVRTVADLAGRRVALGSPGSGTALIARRLLAVAGVPERSLRGSALGLNEAVEALRAGRLDAFFWSGGLPTSGVDELAATLPVRLVPLGDLAAPMRARHGSAYRAATVPAGQYGSSERVATIAVPNVLLCRADTPADLVERVTATLFAAREGGSRGVPQVEALDRRSAVATFPLPLHPGAVRYYRAVKL